MHRLSIRTLMAVIVVSGVGLAALKNANELWAGIMLLAILIIVGMAILGAILLRGRDRAWWLGFALFTGGYLALGFTSLHRPDSNAEACDNALARIRVFTGYEFKTIATIAEQLRSLGLKESSPSRIT